MLRAAKSSRWRARIFVLVAVEEAAAAFLAAVIRTFAAGADCSGQLTEALCCRQRQPRGARQPAAGGGWRPAAGSARPRRSDPPRAGPSAWRVASQAAAATVAPPAVSSTAPPRSPSLPAPPRPTRAASACSAPAPAPAVSAGEARDTRRRPEGELGRIGKARPTLRDRQQACAAADQRAKRTGARGACGRAEHLARPFLLVLDRDSDGRPPALRRRRQRRKRYISKGQQLSP